MTLTAEKFGTQSEWRTFSTVHDTASVIKAPVPARPPRQRPVQNEAILTYLKAVRSLGKTRVSSVEVANALNLPERQVRRAMATMAAKGVKPI